MTTTRVPQDVLRHADALLALVRDGAQVVSQSRCVDHLLDIYNEATEPGVRTEVCTWIGRFGKRTMISTEEVQAAALDICAAAAVEQAFEHLVIGA
jgi:hypothetical protein